MEQGLELCKLYRSYVLLNPALLLFSPFYSFPLYHLKKNSVAALDCMVTCINAVCMWLSSPESTFISVDGKWRLSGLGMCMPIEYSGSRKSMAFDYTESQPLYWNSLSKVGHFTVHCN